MASSENFNHLVLGGHHPGHTDPLLTSPSSIAAAHAYRISPCFSASGLLPAKRFSSFSTEASVAAITSFICS